MDPALVADLSRLITDATEATLGNALVAIIVKGSAINGDFYPYYSDFDMHVYVEPGAMRGPRSLRPDLTFRFQAAIGGIDPASYAVSQVQVIFLNAETVPPGWTPSLPGTYRTIYGTPPGPYPIDDALLIARAADGLRRLDSIVDSLLESLVDKPDHRLGQTVRLIGIYLKPALRQAATVLGAPTVDVWLWPNDQVLALIEPAIIPDHSATRFFAFARRWPDVAHDRDALREMGRLGIIALEALSDFSYVQS